MVVLKFDEQQLTRDLVALPASHRVAFAASCCERLVPNYQAFALMEDWGNPRLLRRALDAAWKTAEGIPL